MSHVQRYLEYRALTSTARGETITHFIRPALGQWSEQEAPTLLLAEYARLEPGANVLQLFCGTGLVGAAIALAAPQSHVTLLDCHAVALEAARRTLDANSVGNAEVLLSDGARAVRDRVFDAVLALQPKSRLAWEQTILDAATVLRPGGAFYLAGANRTGIKTAAHFVEQAFGHVDVVAYRGGCRVLRAVRGEAMVTTPSQYYDWQTIDVEVGGQRLRYASKPGLFSWQKLDAGTRLLIETLQAHPLLEDDRVLDLGCGSGVLTLLAARQAAHGRVLGVDVDCRAVEATRRTLALNHITHAEAGLGDCAESVADEGFTAVVTNPPFHRAQATTYAIAQQIIRDAARLLQPGGRLALVANGFLRYQPIIEQAFGRAELAAQTSQYKVWAAVKTP